MRTVTAPVFPSALGDQLDEVGIKDFLSLVSVCLDRTQDQDKEFFLNWIAERLLPVLAEWSAFIPAHPDVIDDARTYVNQALFHVKRRAGDSEPLELEALIYDALAGLQDALTELQHLPRVSSFAVEALDYLHYEEIVFAARTSNFYRFAGKIVQEDRNARKAGQAFPSVA